MTTTAAGNPVSLLKRLIACPSVTPETAGVLDILATELEALGFTVERLRFEGDGGTYPVDNLFATRGSGGRHLLFCGHTDVVPPGEGWTSPPFSPEERDGFLYGRGAADMKSGVAAFIAAVARLVAAGGADGGTISLAITNDEEAESINGTDKLMQWTRERGITFDFAIVGEPSARERVGDSIKIGRRGSLNGAITVTGTQGHVAYPDKALNPMPALARVILALSGKLDDGNEAFPPSNLEFTSVDVGNQTTNVIPAKAVARFNVRYNDQWTALSLADAITTKCHEIADETGCGIGFYISGKSANVFRSPLGEPVQLLRKVIAEQTGLDTELSTGGGTSDARFIAQYCPVVECGLPGPTMHKVDERIALADLEDLTTLYTAFLSAYLAPGR